jgi:hypothetical protein
MTKRFITLVVDEEVLRVVRIRAEHAGKSESKVIEEAMRRDFNALERIWAQMRIPLSEEEGMKLAVAEVRAVRKERSEAGGP